MDAAYRPEQWHDFYVMVGGSAAALTGLIFVAMSLHLRPILAKPWHRGRAGWTLLNLLSVLLIAGAILAPGQPLRVLAVEIIAVALISPLYGARGFRHMPPERSVAFGLELAVGLLGASLALLGGISLLAEQGGGLWLLLPSAAIALASSVWNAWRLMVDVASEGGAPF
jgi:modulator of FtsH protease